MSYVAGVGSEIGRVGGFKDYIAKNSKLEIVTTQYSNADMPTALNQTTNVLTANPDLVGIFGANEPTAVGMGRAIEQAGLGGKIVAIGFDGNSALQDMIKKGMTLEQVKAAKPTRDYDPRYDTPSGRWNAGMFVEAVYKSLSAKR